MSTEMIELGGILKSPGIAVGISKSVAVAIFARSVLDSLGNVSHRFWLDSIRWLYSYRLAIAAEYASSPEPISSCFGSATVKATTERREQRVLYCMVSLKSGVWISWAV